MASPLQGRAHYFRIRVEVTFFSQSVLSGNILFGTVEAHAMKYHISQYLHATPI
jgi:hypothetical protein